MGILLEGKVPSNEPPEFRIVPSCLEKGAGVGDLVLGNVAGARHNGDHDHLEHAAGISTVVKKILPPQEIEPSYLNMDSSVVRKRLKGSNSENLWKPSQLCP